MAYPCFMWRAFWHLLLTSADKSVDYFSTSKLAVTVAVAAFLFPFIRVWSKEGFRVMLKNVKRDIGISGALVVTVWICVYAWSLVNAVYESHQSLVAGNKKLHDELQLYKGPSIYYMTTKNPAYSGTVNTVTAFGYLANPVFTSPESQRPCQLKITAPPENDDLAVTLRGLAIAVGCSVISGTKRDIDPHIEKEENEGTIRDFILVHAKEAYSLTGFIGGLSNSFSVRRTYSMPANLGDNVIWIQIGPGSPWRHD